MDKILEKSMMEWFKKYAPIFMCVGRKPHPFGNERHIICFGFNVYFVESSDSGRQR